MKIELYYYDQCPFCQIVLRTIKMLHLENKIELKNTLKNPEYRDHHIKITKRSTVPCLYIDGNPLFESADISKWLEDHAEKIRSENGN